MGMDHARSKWIMPDIKDLVFDLRKKNVTVTDCSYPFGEVIIC